MKRRRTICLFLVAHSIVAARLIIMALGFRALTGQGALLCLEPLVIEPCRYRFRASRVVR